MKKIIFTLLIFGMLAISCKKQAERVEVKIMNCIYESYEDQGTAFKKALSDFEQLLIAENILEDGTGKSYKAFFEKMVINDAFNYNPSQSFLNKVIEIRSTQNESFINCQSELRKELKKETELQATLSAILTSENQSPSQIAKGFLMVFDEDDFELDYYKMNVYLFFDTINYTNDEGLIKKLPDFKEEEIEQDVSKAITVYMDGNNHVFVNDEKVTVEELKIQIRDYERTHTSESIIVFKSSRETSYSKYLDIQKAMAEEVNILRDELAKERYNTALDNLTEEQRSEIKKIYPLNLVDAVE